MMAPFDRLTLQDMTLDSFGFPDVAGVFQQARVDSPAMPARSGNGKGRIRRAVITMEQANHQAPKRRAADSGLLWFRLA